MGIIYFNLHEFCFSLVVSVSPDLTSPYLLFYFHTTYVILLNIPSIPDLTFFTFSTFSTFLFSYPTLLHSYLHPYSYIHYYLHPHLTFFFSFLGHCTSTSVALPHILRKKKFRSIQKTPSYFRNMDCRL